MPGRQHERVPYTVEVTFRTASSFLVAYSVNLSKGGVFVETEQLVPPGSPVTLRFEVPGARAIEVSGRVAWRREPGAEDLSPVGLAIEFDAIDDVCGAVVDELAAQFRGLVILVCSADETDRAALVRLTRSIFSNAEVSEATDVVAARRRIAAAGLDLAVVDHDTIHVDDLTASGPSGLPIVALSSYAEGRAQARRAGIAEVGGCPPQQAELQRLLLGALGRPVAVR